MCPSDNITFKVNAKVKAGSRPQIVVVEGGVLLRSSSYAAVCKKTQDTQ